MVYNIIKSISPLKHLAITGSMESGLSELGAQLAGELPSKTLPEEFRNLSKGYVSFSKAREILEDEREKDDSDLTDGPVYKGVPVRDFIAHSDSEEVLDLAGKLGFVSLLDRGIRFLSNGEMRKALLMRELLKQPDLLILDDPFEGLDASSREALHSILEKQRKQGTTFIFCLNHISDLPAWVENLLLLEEGKSLFLGPVKEGLLLLRNQCHKKWAFFSSKCSHKKKEEKLLQMNSIAVRYDERLIFTLDHWTVYSGDHWLVYGPNGCGKSTLLGMISGENIKGYGQDITLFGKKKGTGESVWELKRDIGYISREFHNFYRVNLPLWKVIVSGLYDTVGLYDPYKEHQKEEALRLLAICGISKKEAFTNFKSRTYGIQRLVLLLRALIKQPRLLILDEPCQGLDESSRESFLEGLEQAVRESETTLLYVSHRQEEIPHWIRQVVLFKKTDSGYKAIPQLK